MKSVFLVSFLMASVSYAQTQVVTCTATQPGDVNYYDQATGLARIETITITQGESGPGGYGMVMEMTGTAGADKKPATSKVKLAYAGSYGPELTKYNNALTTDSSLANPLVQFEMETKENRGQALGILTVAVIKNGNVGLITSRYSCK